jgi:hypothetical protein
MKVLSWGGPVGSEDDGGMVEEERGATAYRRAGLSINMLRAIGLAI